MKRLSQLDVLHSYSIGSHVLLTVSPQSKFIISFLVLMLMTSWTLCFQEEISNIEAVASSQVMRWSCLKRGQQSRSCHQTSSLPVCVLKYAASVSNLSCLRKLGIVLTRNFIHDPFLLFSWYWVFHLHQHLSHCSEGLKTTFSLVGPMPLQVFFNLL